MKEYRSLGIPNYGPWYMTIKKNQNDVEEMLKISNFIKDVITREDIEAFKGDINYQFINYGETQLIYVLRVNDKSKYTLVVNQPATTYGVGKQEFMNLYKLNELYPDNVIKPLYYFCNSKNELYVTPYIYQARCIGVETNKWGAWVPEPYYHFAPYFKDEESKINTTMVALLIKFYNEDTNEGLSSIRLDGGDFMLDKEMDVEKFSIDNILKHIKLIAFRSKVHMSLDEYINRLKVELTNEDEKVQILGKPLRCPIDIEDIEEGIKLGLDLRKKEKDKRKEFK